MAELAPVKAREEKRYKHRSNTEPTGSRPGKSPPGKGDTKMSQEGNSAKAGATAAKKPTPAAVNNSPAGSGPAEGESAEMGMHTKMVQDMTQRHGEELGMIHKKHAKEYAEMSARGAAMLGPGEGAAEHKAAKTAGSPPKAAKEEKKGPV